jgi:hypothetical protein
VLSSCSSNASNSYSIPYSSLSSSNKFLFVSSASLFAHPLLSSEFSYTSPPFTILYLPSSSMTFIIPYQSPFFIFCDIYFIIFHIYSLPLPLNILSRHKIIRTFSEYATNLTCS